MWHNQSIFDPTWGEVILLCGLPGTGKDTFIKKYYPNFKVISLDNIRREHKIKPTENQGEVYVIAKEMAKEYLRNQSPFIFNATNFTKLTRETQIDLFHQYSAKVKVIFLETSWEENIKRDKNRRYEVSEKIIDEMLAKLEMAEDFEAETVEWICI
jgi:predicted kinase